ncbi:TonB-dependent receptor [Flavobacterium johnsoniae]|uniref:TonB-dependent receptor n=1 Tax=Flavobacterium johnsoniae TaxID=986 RepID=UPI0025AF7EE0|nr:TonB-dependent receptor [Flavobacterium johnsoniae]WJS95534.1 TonB-dependent receptor [Flavobacterium johnsoniae]
MRFITILLLFTQILFSQKTISGKVLSKETSTSLAGVFVRDTKTENWTISDKDGNFSITIPYFQDIELNFSILGKKDVNQILKNNQNSITVYLEDNTLFLKEVVVTAEKKRQYSELILEKNAINNVQAFSLDDVLQQLPGQTITTFDLNEFKNIVFRTAVPSSPTSTVKAFGTSFVMNDIPISNNENMQAFNPNGLTFNTFGTRDKTFTNANAGVDLREISTNNIEEIKVIQGIPSAKYGDLTSGLVLITTKVGRSPYRVSASLRDATSELNLTKGFKLNANNSMNIALNYLDNKADPRDNLLNYERVNGNMSWLYKNQSSTIKNTVNTSFRLNLDEAKTDPDDINAAVARNQKKGFSISNNFMWKPKNLWIDGININGSFSYDKQFSRRDRYINVANAAATDSYEEGIHDAIILPSQYTSINTVEGIPISTFLTLETTKVLTNESKWIHSLVLGISNRTSANKGEGRKNAVTGLLNFYALTQNNDNTLGYRDYQFTNSKTENQMSAYAEDRIFKKFQNEQILNVDLGVRFDNQLGNMSLQPRINSSFTFNKIIKVRSGFGISSKAPSLNQLYTGDRFLDKIVGSGIYTYPGIYQKAWIQTLITPGDNLNLKPSKSYRTELGFDFNLPFGILNFTGYYNKLYNGFSSEKHPEYRVIPKAEVVIVGTEIPTYQIVGTENFYYFTNTLTNNNSSEDKGIEAIINFKKIKPLNLDISLNASYVHTKDFSNVKTYVASASLLSPETYGVFDPRTSLYDNFTISSNFNYHIPSVGLLISMRTDHVLLKNTKSPTSNFPNGYLDKELVYHDIPVEDRTNVQKYGHLIQKYNESENKLPKAVHNFHLRVSKDFLNGFSVSLYATNFLNVKPYYYDDSGDKILSNVATFSFGTRLDYEF